MASINTYLAQIMSAIYGEEVRSSIHDAISAINSESEQAISDASQAKDSAAASATASASSASSASSSASSANLAKTAALESQKEAKKAQEAAAASAIAAAASKSDASASETNAKQYAQEAQAALDSVDDVMAIKTSLEKYHAIYQDLVDSNGDIILDSSGNQIQGRVLFADAGDIISLQKTISALESLVQNLVALLLNTRVTTLENGLNDADVIIATLQEHALLDSTFN